MTKRAIGLAAFTTGICSLVFACSSDNAASSDQKVPSNGNQTNVDGGSNVITNGDGGATSGPAAACNTPHRSFQIPNEQYFRVFANTTDAVTALRAAQSTNPNPYLDAGNEFEARGAAITAKIFDAYKKLYPEGTAGMTAPPLVVVADSDVANANVFGQVHWVDGPAPSTPFLFRYFRGEFQHGATDEQITFVTAHELGHLLLRNTIPQVFPHIYFREHTTSDNIFFGPALTNDPQTQGYAAQVISAGTRVGQLFATELNGYGTNIGSSNFTENNNAIALYNRVMQYLHQTYAFNTATPAKCMAARQDRQQLDTLVASHFAPIEGTLDLGTDAATVDAMTKDFAANESTCLVHVKKSVQEAITETRSNDDPNFDPDAFAFTPDELDIDTTDPTGNVITKLLTLGQRAQDQMRTLEDDPRVDFPSIRIITQEDDADESAVRIMKVLGIPIDVATGGAFSDKPEEGDACHAQINAGQIPAYAGTINPHHGTCWRNYRNLKLGHALDSCAASWPQ